ncbi:MAG: hypothetical protein H6557_32260 [Lewinellaceae bacterium]|nr:hypothetical protein [Lewinellaceae bacterium]
MEPIWILFGYNNEVWGFASLKKQPSPPFSVYFTEKEAVIVGWLDGCQPGQGAAGLATTGPPILARHYWPATTGPPILARMGMGMGMGMGRFPLEGEGWLTKFRARGIHSLMLNSYRFFKNTEICGRRKVSSSFTQAFIVF